MLIRAPAIHTCTCIIHTLIIVSVTSLKTLMDDNE